MNFAGGNSGGKPEIKQLTMLGGAELENRSFDPVEGRLQSIERMSARSLEIERASGKIYGEGPGWLSRVQVGGASTGPASAKEPAPKDDSLSYLRVDFRKELSGNLHRRAIEFSDQVHAVRGPVASWTDVVDPNKSREALGAQGMVLTTDRLGIAEFVAPGAKDGSLEMTATGNTRVEGRDYTAFAARLTYTAAKSQLVLEGDGRSDAQIRHQLRDSIAAQKILFWQDTGAVQIDGAKSINLGPAQNTPKPPPSPRDKRPR
jgi:lipopolysaccharide export system protein LptA